MTGWDKPEGAEGAPKKVFSIFDKAKVKKPVPEPGEAVARASTSGRKRTRDGDEASGSKQTEPRAFQLTTNGANGQLSFKALAPENQKPAWPPGPAPAPAPASKKPKPQSEAAKGFFAPRSRQPAVVDLTVSPPLKSVPQFGETFAGLAEKRNAKLRGKRLEDAVAAAWPSRGEVHVGLDDDRWAFPETSRLKRTSPWKGKQVDVEWRHRWDDPPSDQPPPRLRRLPLADVASVLPASPSSHPLVARLLAAFYPPGGLRHDSPVLLRHPQRAREGQLWTTTHAPRAAGEMLGDVNIANAMLLKQWAKAVEVQGPRLDSPKRKGGPPDGRDPKRKKVVRRVEKRRRRKGIDSDLESFIASDDDGNFEDYESISDPDETDDEIPPGAVRPRRGVIESPPSSPPPPLQQSTEPTFQRLTNLMLLAGPSGSGKTCAVYAVAEEMGWGVFEVNPGTLRSRKEVERMVGDVGRNHTIPGAGKGLDRGPGGVRSPKKKNGLDAMWGQAPIVLDDEDDDGLAPTVPRAERPSDSTPPPRESSQKVSQSLILLEEVDVLYVQDKDFWAGVVELVARSMRPVVMTCNDVSAVPTELLPIQETLFFEPAPARDVVDYLEAVCLHEGHLVPRAELCSLYEQHRFRPPRVPMESLPHPNPSRPLSHPDLRRSMLQLQFWSQWAVSCRGGGVSWLDLGQGKEARATFSEGPLPPVAWRDDESTGKGEPEDRSFADASVDRRAAGHIEVHESEVAPAGVDDMVADRAQLDPLPSADVSRVPAVASRDHEIACEIAGRDAPDEELARRRLKVVQDSELVADYLRDRAPGLLNPLVTVEYLPFVRQIVAAEDAKDAAFAEDVKEGRVFGFSVGTRRSARINSNKYGRRFDPDPDVLELVRQGGL